VNYKAAGIIVETLPSDKVSTEKQFLFKTAEIGSKIINKGLQLFYQITELLTGKIRPQIVWTYSISAVAGGT